MPASAAYRDRGLLTPRAVMRGRPAGPAFWRPWPMSAAPTAVSCSGR